MSETVQLSFRVPAHVKSVFDALARDRGLPRSLVFRQLVGFGQAVEEARSNGRWVGTTPNREALEQVIIPPA